ncbi:MAG: GNAT family N-acetyltransferase [Acidobacteriota bacterium]|nr:GNAT family N-acetyltransferase [Acidobacteriota bacterium]
MSVQTLMTNVMAENALLPEADVTVTVAELKETERNEVLQFLSESSTHTVNLVGLIRDNGLQSEHNRGTFYGCRNSEGRLEGVALIGHATLVEARTRRALKEFARTAQFCFSTHMILGEEERIEEFWNWYADEGQQMRRACRELLFELKRPLETTKQVGGLRLATVDDLHLIAPVHAKMAEEESGINPLETDREGFLKRCTRRIEKGRVWVFVEEGRLLFKADVQADTTDVIYLEGVWVNQKARGTGLGRRCLTVLCQTLLKRTRSICVLANEENERAHVFYRMCGFKKISIYDTIFLQQEKCKTAVH